MKKDLAKVTPWVVLALTAMFVIDPTIVAIVWISVGIVTTCGLVGTVALSAWIQDVPFLDEGFFDDVIVYGGLGILLATVIGRILLGPVFLIGTIRLVGSWEPGKSVGEEEQLANTQKQTPGSAELCISAVGGYVVPVRN